MCGICGVWGVGDLDGVEAMVQAMPHRGPDDLGTFVDDRVALGMTRLAILDLSANGHQPMSNDDGSIWIVYNGEVANFTEERQRLESLGHHFRSDTDTEVVLRCYEQEGEEFLSRLRGMFALAIYDRRRGPGLERLLLARDPLGIKPLLWSEIGGRLIFASEMKAMLASGAVNREIDPVSLRQLLTWGSIRQPRSMISGVNMLMPGHLLIADSSGMRIRRYWSLAIDRRPDLADRTYHEQVEAMGEILEGSLRRQLASDVPLGAFLSGGLDSSLLVAMMCQTAGERVETFSVGFHSEGAQIDESRDAERIAHHLGTTHHHVLVTGSDVHHRLDHFIHGLDQPSVDGLNSYFVSLAARSRVTVSISGTGGDELFAGYPWFRAAVIEQAELERRPVRTALRKLLGRMASGGLFDRLVSGRIGDRLVAIRDSSSWTARVAARVQVFGPSGTIGVMAPDLRGPAAAGLAARRDLPFRDELASGSVIQRVSAGTLRGYTADQLLRDIDATSMVHSLEVRVPFLDQDVVDAALALPDSTKLNHPSELSHSPDSSYRDTGSKRILVDIGRELLPAGLDDQPKRGFAMPMDSWLRQELSDRLDEALSPATVASRGLLDPQAVTDIREDFTAGRRTWTGPWLLMVLELWCREMIDAGGSQSS